MLVIASVEKASKMATITRLKEEPFLLFEDLLYCIDRTLFEIDHQ